ncbi:MAG: glycoside hydrolase family 16 protein, partial [Flavobacteriia bacterium]|nr:glycoside hydrolase family 16 protein [Flavobacteriia bacterium]
MKYLATLCFPIVCLMFVASCKEADPKEATPKEYALVWADEFDTPGLPDASKWILKTDAPENGAWYNNELQHYTDRIDNAEVLSLIHI